jgi:hypothetical protein
VLVSESSCVTDGIKRQIPSRVSDCLDGHSISPSLPHVCLRPPSLPPPAHTTAPSGQRGRKAFVSWPASFAHPRAGKEHLGESLAFAGFGVRALLAGRSDRKTHSGFRALSLFRLPLTFGSGWWLTLRRHCPSKGEARNLVEVSAGLLSGERELGEPIRRVVGGAERARVPGDPLRKRASGRQARRAF